MNETIVLQSEEGEKRNTFCIIEVIRCACVPKP
jgi:hypothetical protein